MHSRLYSEQVMDSREKEEKENIIHWAGLMRLHGDNMKRAVAATLVVFSLSMIMMGADFRHFEISAGTVLFEFNLRLVIVSVAVGALLFGPIRGGIFGLFVGTVSLLHAYYIPLDEEEKNHVNPIGFVVAFAVAGFLLGMIFYLIVSRIKSDTKKCIAMVCSILAVFMAADLTLYFEYLFIMAPEYMNRQMTIPQVLSYVRGEYIKSYAFVTAGLETLFAGTAAVVLYRLIGDDQRASAERSVRQIFTTRLFLIAFNVFMIAAAVQFFMITDRLIEQSVSDAEYDISRMRRYIKEFGIDIDEVAKGYDPVNDFGVAVFKDGIAVGANSDYHLGRTLEEFCGGYYFGGFPTAGEFFDHLSGQKYFTIYSEDFADEGKNIYTYSVVRKFDDMYYIVVCDSKKVLKGRTASLYWSLLITFSILALTLITTRLLLEHVIVSRIDKANASLHKITEGALDERVGVGGLVEFSALSEGINKTVESLERSMDEISERIERELSIAADIQGNALPTDFPAFPDIGSMDIYASMDPAREVGGDFYDFFRIGKDKIGIVVGDVSGKGIPAALFMMAAKTEIHSCMESGIGIDEAIKNANLKLCEGNDANMFVTVFAGVFDHKTGILQCVNAGHNPPLVYHDGGWEYVRNRSGRILGLFADTGYKTFTIKLCPGDAIFIYTDGVTEARDSGGGFYEEERLQKLLNGNGYRDCKGLLKLVRDDIASYSDGAEQADDITMLALSVTCL